MWTFLKWFFICWALLLILSDIQIRTSLYKYEDNQVVIKLPRWQTKQPWATFEWHAGRISSHWYGLQGQPMTEEMPSD